MPRKIAEIAIPGVTNWENEFKSEIQHYSKLIYKEFNYGKLKRLRRKVSNKRAKITVKEMVDELEKYTNNKKLVWTNIKPWW